MKSKVKADELEGDMTSMIDVVFLLLIFFMCAAKFKTLESKLEAHLPKDIGESAAPAPDVTPRRIELKVDKYGTDSAGRKVVKEVRIMLGQNQIGRYLHPTFAESDREREDLVEIRDQIFSKLLDELTRSEQAQDPSVRSPTFIAPDLRIPSDDVVQALDAAIGAGIKDLTFAGKVSDVAKLRREDGIEE